MFHLKLQNNLPILLVFIFPSPFFCELQSSKSLRCTGDWRKISYLKSQFLVDFRFSCSPDLVTNGCSWFCFWLNTWKTLDFRKESACNQLASRIHWVLTVEFGWVKFISTKKNSPVKTKWRAAYEWKSLVTPEYYFSEIRYGAHNYWWMGWDNK